MDSIRALPAMRAAFEAIVRMEPQTRRDHLLLTEIPAPPFGEGPRARAFAALLAESGADSVWLDAEGNVLALIDGTERHETVALAAHLDTVFPEGTDVTVHFRGDTLYAPGIGDDTRGLAVLLALLRAVREADLSFSSDVLLVGTVGEEGLGDLRGVRHLIAEKAPAIDRFIAIDGGRLGDIINQALGSYRYRISVSGPGGHSWGAFGAGNPVHALATIVHRFDEKAASFTKTGPKTSYNIGRFEGGTSVNAIPEIAWLEVDMRSVDPGRLDGIDALLHEAVKEGMAAHGASARQGDSLRVEVVSIGRRPSGSTSADHALVRRALAGAQVLGGEASLSIASTDANVPISLGIPSITIGRGGQGGNAHALDEWWLNKDGHLGIQWALLLAAAEAGVSVRQ
jgi:acetylornithine deacetylase/succinyl-diaminopimelate desuccinylase-like protein